MKSVKCLIVFFFVLALANCPRALAQAPAPGPVGSAPVQAGGPSIQLAETSYDFGEVVDGKDYAHDFKVRNVGTAPLEIKKVLPG